MKFEHQGMKFEVSNLDHIVINHVRQVIKPAEKGKSARVTNEKERANGDKGTRVWIKFDFGKGRIRWLKYHDVVNSNAAVLDPEAAQGYSSHTEMSNLINLAMQRPDMHVWFSGTYVNIEITENYQEVQLIKAQEAARKRKTKLLKMFSHAAVSTILGEAVRQSGAKVVRHAIDTPFGPVPVMTITGSGKRDLLKDMEQIEKTGTFVSLDEAAKKLKIPRRKSP